MLSPFALPLRTILSAARELRVNCAKHRCIFIEHKKSRSFASLGMTCPAAFFPQPAKPRHERLSTNNHGAVSSSAMP
jgi:hypothetical protein